MVSDALIAANRASIIRLALSERLPTILSYDDYVEAGGLMSYGPSYSDLFRRSADMVDKILHGTKPGDIPVEQPTKFDLAVNLKTAKALGLSVPATPMGHLRARPPTAHLPRANMGHLRARLDRAEAPSCRTALGRSSPMSTSRAYVYFEDGLGMRSAATLLTQG